MFFLFYTCRNFLFAAEPVNNVFHIFTCDFNCITYFSHVIFMVYNMIHHTLLFRISEIPHFINEFYLNIFLMADGNKDNGYMSCLCI